MRGAEESNEESREAEEEQDEGPSDVTNTEEVVSGASSGSQCSSEQTLSGESQLRSVGSLH